MLIAVLLLIETLFWGYCYSFDREPAVSGNSGEGETAAVRVGLSMAEGDNTWVQNMCNDIKDALAELGMELLYKEPAENTEEAQYQCAEELMDEGIDYLLLIPCSEDAVSPIAVEAAIREIPVILISGEEGANSLCTVTISVDYEREGELCAQILAEAYAGRECIIVEILGPQDSSIARARAKGFEEEVSKTDNMQILKRIQGNFDLMTGQAAMSEIIRNNPKGTVNAVFACSDEDGLGALYALKLAGYQPGTDVSLVSVGGVQDAVKAVITGEYLATVSSGRYLGNVTAEIILRMENGEKVSPHFVMPYQCLDAGSSWHELVKALY